MSRISVSVLGLSLLMVATAGPAWALGSVEGPENKSMAVPVHGTKIGPNSTDRQKCIALNKCRYQYTRCYNKLVKAKKNIETEKVVCVKPYQKCINASFQGFDFFMTRWFNPEANCKNF